MSFSSEAGFQWGVLLGIIVVSFIATFVAFRIFDSGLEESSSADEGTQ